MGNVLLRRIGTAVLVIGSIIYTVTLSRQPASASKKKDDDEDTLLPEYRRVFDRNPIIPDGWTFGVVWSTIYTGTAAYAIHQALPSQLANPRYRNASSWLVVSYILNAIFGRLFADPHRASIIGSDLVTKASLPVALALHQQLEIGETKVGSPEKYLRIPFGLYAGWLTTASVVGTPNLLYTLKLWEPEPQRDTPLFIGVLGATAGVAYIVARRLNDPYYLLPFVAGFAGIATKQYGKNDAIARAAAAFSLLTAGLVVRWLPNGSFRPLQRDIENTDFEVESEEDYWENETPNEEDESYSYTSL